MAPRIAITVGDPRGVGAEVLTKVLAGPPVDAEFVVLGPRALIEPLPAERIPIDADVPVADEAPCGARMRCAPEVAGRLAGLAVERAVALAAAGSVDAVVTGPAEKRALHLAGYRYPGHTEWLGALCGVAEVAMMLTVDRLRVVLVTTHLALRDVARTLTVERVMTAGRITRRALERWWGIDDPRLALCALNPHAGEGGLFGEEDDTLLRPAAEELDAAGPIPADTVFVRALRGEFDAVLTPYHDVGMTAIKVAGFGRGVNVTLGLPFIRTAPDHGTAMDIAGKGIADPGSLSEAVALAARLAARDA